MKLIVFFINENIYINENIQTKAYKTYKHTTNIQMKAYIRKADIILLIVLIVLGTAASAALAMQQSAADAGSKVVIKSDGALYATYPLDEERTVVVPAPKQLNVDAPEAKPDDAASVQYDYYNVVNIRGGQVTVSEASCKNQVCVLHGSISHPGESIVCLPNRLIVSIEGGQGGESYDSVTS